MPRGAGAGEHLRSLLDGRDWQAHEANDPLEALAELCLLERIQASRVGWGLQRVEGLALVVLEPESFSQLNAMVSAARRYVPKATLWSYVDGMLCPLAPGDETKPVKPRATRSSFGVPQAAAQPSRGAADEAEEVDEPSPASEPEPPHISREEITMLLDGNDRDPST